MKAYMLYISRSTYGGSSQQTLMQKVTVAPRIASKQVWHRRQQWVYNPLIEGTNSRMGMITNLRCTNCSMVTARGLSEHAQLYFHAKNETLRC